MKGGWKRGREGREDERRAGRSKEKGGERETKGREGRGKR